MSLVLVPLKREAAERFVRLHHRHLPPPAGDVVRVGLARAPDMVLVGVGVAGRPVSRVLDDGWTLEVSRVAVLPATPNACSMLYGALRKAGIALGYQRFVTYTLPEEGGASLRASGWVEQAQTEGGEWSCTSRPRDAVHRPDPKTRWVWPAAAWEGPPRQRLRVIGDADEAAHPTLPLWRTA